MSRSLDDLHPSIRFRAMQFLSECKAKGYDVIITQTLRTAEEQDELYAQGRTKPGKVVTKARGTPAESIHQFGLAFDVAVKKDGKIVWDAEEYEKIGPIGEGLGLTWGGVWRFKDLPHYQLTQGLTLEQLRQGQRPLYPLANQGGN